MDGISGNRFPPGQIQNVPAVKEEYQPAGSKDRTELGAQGDGLILIDRKQASALARGSSIQSKEGQAVDHVIQVTDATFESFIRNAALPVLVNFHNPTWKNCSAYAPVVSKLSDDYEGKLLVAKIDKPDNPLTYEKYGIEGTPMTVFFNGGVETKRIHGYMKYEQLKAATDGVLESLAPKE